MTDKKKGETKRDPEPELETGPPPPPRPPAPPSPPRRGFGS